MEPPPMVVGPQYPKSRLSNLCKFRAGFYVLCHWRGWKEKKHGCPHETIFVNGVDIQYTGCGVDDIEG
ncbi:hypothetical protein V2J09_006734 [Rumex salicifolius]